MAALKAAIRRVVHYQSTEPPAPTRRRVRELVARMRGFEEAVVDATIDRLVTDGELIERDGRLELADPSAT